MLTRIPGSADPPDITLAYVISSRQQVTNKLCAVAVSNPGGPISKCPDPNSLNLTKRDHAMHTTSPLDAMLTY